MIVVVEVHNVARDPFRTGLRSTEARDALAIGRKRARRIALEDDVDELSLLEPRIAELPLVLLDAGGIPLPVNDRIHRTWHPSGAPHRHAHLVGPPLPAGLPGLGTSGSDRRIGSRVGRTGSAAGRNDGNRHEE